MYSTCLTQVVLICSNSVRNREHAKRSRYRKKLLTKSLEQSVDELREETKKLREELYASVGKEKVLSILNKQKNDDLQIFLKNLKEPKNRIVSGAGLRFLKSLQKRIPKKHDTAESETTT